MDCGGPDCRRCAYEQQCQGPSDCASELCSGGQCDSTLRVFCSCENPATCGDDVSELVVYFSVENSGTEQEPLTNVSLHYYYSADGSNGAEQSACTQLNVEGGSCTAATLLLSDVETSDPYANREAELGFREGWIAPGTQTGLNFFTISGNAPYTRSNDFSFADLISASSGGSIPCRHIILKNEAEVAIWGVPPEP